MSDSTFFQNMEILREKFNISYEEAKEILDLNNGDLVSSLISLEQKYSSNDNRCMVKNYLDSLKTKLIKLYKEGQNQRVLISRKDNIIADIPLTAVVISSFAFVIYPILLPIKLTGILLFDIDFKVIDNSGKVYHINSDVKQKVKHAFSVSKDKINDFVSNVDIQSTTSEIKNKAVQFGKKTMEHFNEIIENNIMKSVKEKNPTYTKFVYDDSKDEIQEDFNNGSENLENSEKEVEIVENIQS